MTEEEHKRANEIMTQLEVLRDLKFIIVLHNDEHNIKDNLGINISNIGHHNKTFLYKSCSNDEHLFINSLFEEECCMFFKKLLRKINSEIRKLEKEYKKL
jgi:hypothetical protein